MAKTVTVRFKSGPGSTNKTDKDHCNWVSGSWELKHTTLDAEIYLFVARGWMPLPWMPQEILGLLPVHLRVPRTVMIKVYTDEPDPTRGITPEELFDQERKAFETMDRFQPKGVVRWYGAVDILHDKRQAVAKQYLEGRPLHHIRHDKSLQNRTDELCAGIQCCFEQISKCGVLQEDADPDRLDCYILAHGLPRRAMWLTTLCGFTLAFFLGLLGQHSYALHAIVSFCSSQMPNWLTKCFVEGWNNQRPMLRC